MNEERKTRFDKHQSPGIFSKIYGLTMYVTSQVAVVLWAMFLSNRGPFKIDFGEPTTSAAALIMNVGLVMLFLIQHTIMSRKAFKHWLAGLIPPHLVRSTFVGMAGVILLAISALWKPMPDVIYQLSGIWAAGMWILYALGWIIVILSTYLIDHLELHGVRQSFKGITGHKSSKMMTPSLYKIVRHPMMLGFLIVLWATPNMTLGRLLIAVAFTIYIRIGITFEERELIKEFGGEYENYQKHVPALIPLTKWSSKVNV